MQGDGRLSLHRDQDDREGALGGGRDGGRGDGQQKQFSALSQRKEAASKEGTQDLGCESCTLQRREYFPSLNGTHSLDKCF